MAAKQRSEMKIAVLAGGTSDEREISLNSGKGAAAALVEAGYGTVEMVDPAKPDFLTSMMEGGYDVAFIALHGKGGEDGSVQNLLEYMGIPYTGSDPVASMCAMDKELAKFLYVRSGLKVAKGLAVQKGKPFDIQEILEVVGPESFVKPAINGSSYGVTLVKGGEDLGAAIEYAFQFGEKVLVEQRAVGTEVTVGVLGDGGTLRALPVVEICMPEASEYYDLEVKYVDPTDIHRIPAHLPEDVYAMVQDLACRAHEALGCYGVSRTDFIITADGPVILETNTIPGMTETSLFPDEVRHAGFTFAEAVAELVDLALVRVNG